MSAQYAAIAAKLKAMYAKTISDAEMAQLAEKQTVGEICDYLKSTEAYRDVLEDIDEENAHRGIIELRMKKKLMDDFFRIYEFSDRQFMTVMDFVFRRREVEFLKNEIHYIYTKDERKPKPEAESAFESFFEKYTKIDKDAMQNAKTLDDCYAACKNTCYAEPLGRAANLNADFFTTGTLLDAYYFQLTRRDIKSKIPANHSKGIKRIIGTTVDMLNLLWIYRGKKYFNFANEMIFTYILNMPYRLTRETIKRLADSESVDAFLDAARKTPYAALFDGVEDGVFPEENYQYMEHKIAKSVFRLETDSPAAIIAYDRLKSYEIWRITIIIE
ncbi:MAG: V-type ATPase subunit, partial [Firmicutes bacterium]|nr:V-type ATPase subunit [Bacillota bacterium]